MKKGFMIGIGFLYPQVYKKLVEAVKAGTFGDEWKKYLEEDPGAVINIGLIFQEKIIIV